ncbi:uncharacterized protein PHACADRAFT_196184 [Phanerochaete carnosa HHB-10118-sp]|uniref:Cyclase n=1 Tax=Phanerochaete carnosa (strain HHB-10118-sp) TaxID=650164 RepID=K5WA80_PHACS|nr:uncharacterized protein PHACADRAFT_196184 [Phanerochaete carnosa HHB-10118-sp]EKM56130.1 hypothetical protein PHACADRAFT_196184 [Phanerochaete carnosa HHB-10118-sp]
MADRKLPSFDELPHFHEYTGCAWEVWGKDDELGTVNLLTEKVISEAAKEIKIGKTFCLNLPINYPSKPTFKRQPAIHTQWMLDECSNDDTISINTQSGTQWDGLRHFGIFNGHNVFYQNIPASEFALGHFFISDPEDLKRYIHKIKLGIHNWAQHGICGRGVLLDMVRFYTEDGKKPLPYDPWSTHAIPASDFEACAKKQGVTFKTGDILIYRGGFTQKWYAATRAERESLSAKPEAFAGIDQSEDMKRFLWDNHFAAIASDQPCIERWPKPEGTPHMHSTLLGLWGMPIGEYFELEKLAEACAESKRYTFFFTSWPLNILGGAASPPNAAAYF